MSRWIRVQASIFNHELFSAEPFTEREAWLWLITRAAWKETKHRIGQTVHDVEIGAFFITLRDMQKAWKWKSDKRVRSFLKLLENEEMITLKSDAGKTHVTICNYSRYQEVERSVDAERTQAGRTKDTNTPVITSSLRSEVKAQAPAKPSVKSELMKVLNEGQAQAVIEHRRALKKPLTFRAAELLIKKLARCPDPSAAADMMIESGWLSIEPEWIENRRKSNSRNSTAHNRPLTHTDIWGAALREKGILSHEPDSHEPNILDASDEHGYRESNVHPLRIASARSY